MDIQQLLTRARPSSSPLIKGEWATLVFRPDLGSQQEFIVGVALTVDGDAALQTKWLPSLTKLSYLYGDALGAPDTKHLFEGSDMAMRASFRTALNALDSGTPHVRVVPCGYMAGHDIDAELARLLKRQAGALWQDTHVRDSPMNDDWAYATIMRALGSLRGKRDPFVPGRVIEIGGKKLDIGLNNGVSYGNIVSARYATFATIQTHVQASALQLISAHRLAKRPTIPAMFVVLPEAATASEIAAANTTVELLASVEDSGLAQFSSRNPDELAAALASWAA